MLCCSCGHCACCVVAYRTLVVCVDLFHEMDLMCCSALGGMLPLKRCAVVVQTRAFILVAGSVLRVAVFMKLWSALGVLHLVCLLLCVRSSYHVVLDTNETCTNYYRLLLK